MLKKQSNRCTIIIFKEKELLLNSQIRRGLVQIHAWFVANRDIGLGSFLLIIGTVQTAKKRGWMLNQVNVLNAVLLGTWPDFVGNITLI
jgi:hypothetical protein